MLLYLETSSLVGALLGEPESSSVRRALHVASAISTSALTMVEARAALAQARKGRRLTASRHAEAGKKLQDRLAEFDLVPPQEPILIRAAELAEAFTLRGYDAVHLASAETATVDTMATKDAEIARAARALGLDVTGAIGS